MRSQSARVLPIGPLETSFAVKDSERNEHNPLGTVALEKEQKLSGEVEQWLDNQPSGSVLYIAFGSIFSLPAEQIREVAHALEASGQRFLWILRPPETPQVMVSKQNFKDELKDLLPSGYPPNLREIFYTTSHSFISHFQLQQLHFSLHNSNKYMDRI